MTNWNFEFPLPQTTNFELTLRTVLAQLLDGLSAIDDGLDADVRAISGGDLVGTAATQTLTNKTLSSPVINGGTISAPAISSPVITGTASIGATNLAITGNQTITGNVTLNGIYTALDRFFGDGSGLTNTNACGGMASTGSITVNADSDVDGIGEIVCYTRGSTTARMRIANDGTVSFDLLDFGSR